MCTACISCQECEESARNGNQLVRFKEKHATCFVCEKKVEKVLDLHHTKVNLCSSECEDAYWLDILY